MRYPDADLVAPLEIQAPEVPTATAPNAQIAPIAPIEQAVPFVPERSRRRLGWRGRERAGWLFMRGSGLLLVVLVAGHIITNVLLGDGVRQINFAFVAGKWSNPFWQVWSLLLLWLGLLHGTNGLRGIITDYVHRGNRQRVLTIILYLVAAVVVVLGTLVIVTLDPCPADAPAHLLPSFCER